MIGANSMRDPKPRRIKSGFRAFFFRGLVVLLPTILTLWIAVKAYQFVDDAIAEPINRGIRQLMAKSTPHLILFREAFEPTDEDVRIERAKHADEPVRQRPGEDQVRKKLRKDNVEAWWGSRWFGAMDLIGIVVAIVAVYFTGRLLGGFVGRRIYRRVERGIVSLPVFKQVYPYIKQVVDFLFGEERPIEFKRVVLVEYPRKGLWAVGLLTGPAMRTVSQTAGDSVTVFIPSSPTPFTGYTISVPKSEVYDLPITIDEALRFTVSGGVLLPDRQALPPSVGPGEVRQPPTPPSSEAVTEPEAGADPPPPAPHDPTPPDKNRV